MKLENSSVIIPCLYFLKLPECILLSFFLLQGKLFNRLADDLDTWMDEVETQLMSEDHGKDITSTSNLLKKHQVSGWLYMIILLTENTHDMI